MLLVLASALFLHLPPAYAQVDLHAHLFLKPGMGPLLTGSSHDPVQARSWDSRLETKSNSSSLLSHTTPKIIVVSLYAHPWLSNPLNFDWRANTSLALDREYEELEGFVKAHSDRFILAKNPLEARKALSEKKQVLVLSIEGAYGALETEADLQKWVDRRGLAILTPFHLSEDYFGGSALMPPLLAIFQSPISFFESLIDSGGKCLHSVCKSPVGIKSSGKILLERLMEKKVWIDVAHANEKEIAAMLLMFQPGNLPLLVTHTALRSAYPAERGLGRMEIEYLKKTGGIAGLLPSNDFLNLPPDAPCQSGLQEFKTELNALDQAIGPGKTAFGTDVNAPIEGLSPACPKPTGEIMSAFESRGYFRYEDLGALADYAAPDPAWSDRSVENFLASWERIRPGK